MHPLIEKSLLVDGRTVSYYVYKNILPCPWIICFSGAGSDSFDWLIAAKDLSSIANVLIVDKPGFLGTAPYPEPLAQEQIALDVMAICKDEQVGRAHLIGHSLGYLSALIFAYQSRDRFETSSITSLDGISLNPLSIEVLNQMAPSDNLFQTAYNRLLSFGFLKLSPRERDYPSRFFSHANDDYLKKIMKQRGTRRHNKSIWFESMMTPKWCNKFHKSQALKDVMTNIPQHCLQAVEVSRPFDEQPEVKYFPHLRELFFSEHDEKIEWCKQTARESGGFYESIDSEHFIQWHFSKEVTRFMKLVLENDHVV
jgi:pimeloyl-ACP methyl ester carboxylesterase